MNRDNKQAERSFRKRIKKYGDTSWHETPGDLEDAYAHAGKTEVALYRKRVQKSLDKIAEYFGNRKVIVFDDVVKLLEHEMI